MLRKDILLIMIDACRKYVNCQQQHATVVSRVEKSSRVRASV